MKQKLTETKFQNEKMDKLNEISTKVDEGFSRLSAELSAATKEIEAFVRKTEFEMISYRF